MTPLPHYTPPTLHLAYHPVGRMLNNQARVLESRTTRTGVPHGPGASVLPPQSYYDNLPADLDVDRMGRGSVGSADTSNTTSTTRSNGTQGTMGRAHKAQPGPKHTAGGVRTEGRGKFGPELR